MRMLKIAICEDSEIFVEIIKKNIETILKVPYELTWSCYEGKDKPCGVCGTCIDRQEAFLKNGVTDPLLLQ